MTPAPPAADPAARRLRSWQSVTVGTLFTGYLGYYVCRSNLSVVTPLLLDEYGGVGLDKGDIGDIASLGVVFYAVGKSVNGLGADVLGGRRLFLFGLFASVLMTLLFTAVPARAAALGAGSASVFAAVVLPLGAVWAANRFVQSMGWGGLVQIAARWTEPHRLGTVMGVLSMSYLVGDAVARLYLGQLVALGLGWRAVFDLAAVALGGVGVVGLLLLRGRPADVGLPEPPPPAGNVYGQADGRRPSVWELAGPLFASRAFWLVCGMNAGLTLLRETFNLWTPLYLTQAAGLDPGTAGMTSLIFPLAGAVSAVAAGWLVDRAGGRYGRVMVPMLLASVGALLALAFVPGGQMTDAARAPVVLALIAVAAFCLIGPYTFCSGVLAVNLGGQRGSSTSAGFIDTAGYLAAVLAGSGVGRLADAYGWANAFAALAGVAGLTLAVALVYGLTQDRRR